MKFHTDKISTCQELLKDYKKKKNKPLAEKIVFEDVGDKDVYNITAPFKNQGKVLIAGRVEKRESEHSKVIFFSKREGRWYPEEELPQFALQDPFVTYVKGELI